MVSGVYIGLYPVDTGDNNPVNKMIFGPLTASTAAFKLSSGQYMVTVLGTFSTATLQILGADGTTYLTAATAISAAGVALVSLPEGVYKVALA